jgi:hypothetical protein
VQPVAVHAVSVPKATPAPKPAVRWPTGASATLSLTSTPTSTGVGGLPVALSSTGTVRADLTVAARTTAGALGVRGVVLSVARADGAATAARVHLSVSYAGFAGAYGSDYGSRLALVQLPACALTTPTQARCRTETPLGSHNDAHGQAVSSDVTLGASPLVLATVATPSGSGGNFAAEPLSEATNDWVTGDSSGAYTYSYPIDMPPVPGGLKPTVRLRYDSLATAGLSSATNNEPSWIGDGWDYTPGFVETDYAPCSSYAIEPRTADLCGDRAQTTLSFNGMTTPLVEGANGWRAEADGGAQVIRSGTSWEVIEPDGTQYYFGRDTLPGYVTGDATTNSQWTVPVWQGCGQAAFCNQPWRDMLSYVVDPHGNAIAYSYTTQANAYAEGNGTTANGSYVAGGVLSSISYGFRDGHFYTSPRRRASTSRSRRPGRTRRRTSRARPARRAPCTRRRSGTPVR